MQILNRIHNTFLNKSNIHFAMPVDISSLVDDYITDAWFIPNHLRIIKITPPCGGCLKKWRFLQERLV